MRITAAVADGEACGEWTVPEGPGPFPLVVQYMDALGLRPAMTAMAERLSGLGVAVLQPDLYWRSGPFAPFSWSTAFLEAGERARIQALMGAVRREQVVADTRALVAAMPDRVRKERIGVVGYCMGGRAAFLLATDAPDLVVAAASIHGGGLVTDAPDSPHRSAGRIRAEVYVGVAAEDRSATPEQMSILAKALDDAGVRYRMDHPPGALHGYAVPDCPVYQREAAEQHVDRLTELFGRL